MSAAVHHADRPEPPATTTPRDVGLLLTDDRCLVYDTQNHCAWIQSDSYLGLDDTR